MKTKSTPKLFTVIYASAIFLLSIVQINAQEKGVYEIQTDHSTVSTSADRTHFYDLAFNLHPTIYVKNNNIRKIYGKGDIKKINLQDANSFNILSTGFSDYKEIELISLELNSKNDLLKSLDLTQNNDLSNLQYIFVRCYFECDEADIQKLIKASPNVRIFYMWGNPS